MVKSYYYICNCITVFKNTDLRRRNSFFGYIICINSFTILYYKHNVLFLHLKLFNFKRNFMNFKLKNKYMHCRSVNEILSYFYISSHTGKQRTTDNIMIILN